MVCGNGKHPGFPEIIMVLTGNRDNMCCKLTSDSASIASSAALKQTKKQTLQKKKHTGHFTV